MKEKIQNWLHDLGVALGLIEPPLQPIPIRTDNSPKSYAMLAQDRNDLLLN